MNATRTINRYALPRPFLKWVGGKGQLLAELTARVERAGDFGRYHEPFVGGGALFFELYRASRLKKQAWLSDNNPRLIEAYIGVRDHVDEVIRLLKRHKRKHSEEYFYQVRGLGQANNRARPSSAASAARTIYLNKTCYNGLYRENRKGEFNSPFGRYKNPPICDEENLRAVSKALKKAKIENRHFETVVDRARPAYHPVSKTASFTSYVSGGFGEDSQRLLARVYKQLNDKGVQVLLSNSMTGFVQDLYKPFRIDQVTANRAINSRPDRRGKVSEALVRNF